MIPDPKDTSLMVSAYLDGALSDDEAAALRAKIEVDQSLRERLETFRALRETLHAKFSHQKFPESLRLEIDETIRVECSRAVPNWIRFAASFLLVAAISSLATWTMLKPDYSGSKHQVEFPKDLGIRYATVSSGPTDLVRDLYANDDVLEAVRSGRPIPYGAVLVRNVFDVERDQSGAPVKDADGKVKRSKLLFTAVMEKRPGRGEFSAGEWWYQSFSPDRSPMHGGSGECFACHDKMRNQDFVFSLDRMKIAKH